MSRPLITKLFLVVLSVTALVFALIAFMPKPIDMDLGKIGNGNKSVVFVYDPNSVASYEQSTQINIAREMLNETTNLLVAKTGDPDGEAFKQRYRVGSLFLLFFSAEGKLVERKSAILSADEIVEILARIN